MNFSKNASYRRVFRAFNLWEEFYLSYIKLNEYEVYGINSIDPGYSNDVENGKSRGGYFDIKPLFQPFLI